MPRAARENLAEDPRIISRSIAGLMNPKPSSLIFDIAGLRHHAEGIFLCERIFGMSLRNSDGREIPIRIIGEQHIKEDLGRIPTAQDWLSQIQPQKWMYGQRPGNAEPSGPKASFAEASPQLSDEAK
jgi:Domain of unknown function (DUF6915)